MLGLKYDCKSPTFQEKLSPEHPERGVMRIPEFFAVQKALSLSSEYKTDLVISYDTAVIYEKKILGKPVGPDDAFTMLKCLNGRSHYVVTGVALASESRILSSGNEITEVTFARTKDETLKKYAYSNEPKDKAGSYAIQGRGAMLVEKINGCFFNVMGAPVHLTLQMLEPYLN